MHTIEDYYTIYMDELYTDRDRAMEGEEPRHNAHVLAYYYTVSAPINDDDIPY